MLFSQCSEQPKVELSVDTPDKKVDVLIDGQLFTSYIYPDNIMKPVLWPVMSEEGNMLTRSFPMEVKAGDRTDHPHHVGVWLNYGDVNGLDFWNNSEAIPADKRDQYGRIVHKSVDMAESGKGKAVLETSEAWKAPDGEVLLNEHTRFEFIVKGHNRIIDRTTTLKAMVDTVKFTDNKEGMFGIRVARELELPSDQPTKLIDSHGNVTEVKEMDNSLVNGNYHSAEGIEGLDVWGTRCRWMKLSGDIKGEDVALVIIDHPSNVGYPTYWHARGYGLFAANTLGQKIFSNGKNELNYTMERGDEVTFRYRLVVAEGKISDDEINILADAYANK